MKSHWLVICVTCDSAQEHSLDLWAIELLVNLWQLSHLWLCHGWCLFVSMITSRVSKHRMMKLGEWVHCTKILAQFEFGGHSPMGVQCVHTLKMCVAL